MMKRFFAVTFAVAVIAPASAVAQAENEPAIKIVPAPATTLPGKRTPDRTSGAISAKDLMTRLYIFADDSMMGRDAGGIGNAKATAYIAAELRRMGLKPAGDNGTFFQTIPLKRRSLDPKSTVTLNGTPLKLGSEWTASARRNATSTDVPVIFGGSIGDSASLIDPTQTAGKAVVFAVAPGGARAARQAGRFAPGARAVVVVTADRALAVTRRPSYFLDDSAALARGASTPQIQMAASVASRIFGRAIDSVATGTTGGTLGYELLVAADATGHPARNVVAILPGSDPKLRGQYVALGAHSDHVGFNTRPVDHDSLRIYNHIVRPSGADSPDAEPTAEQQAEINRQLAAWRAAHPGSSRADSIFNGADDDGSGSVALLEVAEAMAGARARPKRSVLFVWHTAEEKGLLGATYFTDHPSVPRDSIVAALNMDMVGRGNAWDVTGRTIDGAPLRGGDDYLMLVGSRRLSTELGNLVDTVNVHAKHRFTFDYALDANGHPMNIYCRSDHYHYARYGIPVSFFTTGLHSDYHQVTDEPQYIDYTRMARIAGLVRDVALRAADSANRPVVDQPKPDPNGSCRQ